MRASNRKIAFVTNIPGGQQSGGFSGMNSAMIKALSSCCELEYIGPINPKPRLGEHIVSKLKRLARLKGAFFFFSEARLLQIAAEVEEHLHDIPHDLCFFHGFTPWIAFRCRSPYIAWSDCTFSQYVSIFHDQRQFCEKDLERIKQDEAAWLKAARLVLFRNRWAAEGAIADYGLDRERVGYVGNYGLIEPPPADTFKNKGEFVFVSTNFRLKGGPIVIEAFKQLRKRHPYVRLTLVGASPPKSNFQSEGISYLGFLRKEIPEERARLTSVFARAHAVVHPTTADINPMVLIEAGYFGCPAISSRICGLPEIVEDGVSGILLNAPPSVEDVTTAMERLLTGDQVYRGMRQAARARMLMLFSREVFENRVRKYLNEVLPADAL